jgi:hypothetical protein
VSHEITTTHGSQPVREEHDHREFTTSGRFFDRIVGKPFLVGKVRLARHTPVIGGERQRSSNFREASTCFGKLTLLDLRYTFSRAPTLQGAAGWATC